MNFLLEKCKFIDLFCERKLSGFKTAIFRVLRLFNSLRLLSVMKKLLLATGLFFLYAKTPAQTTDRISYENNDVHTTIDEKMVEEDIDDIKAPVKLLKVLPVPKNGSYSYSKVASSKRRGTLTATESGDVVFSTNYRGNYLYGTWIRLYRDGAVLDSGGFKKNVPDGQWLSWYPDGKLRSVRTYSATKFFSITNEISRGNDKISFYTLAKLGLVHPSRFKNIINASNSFVTMSSMPGVAYTPPFTQCLHHGLYMNFYANGAPKDSGYYKDGLRDGIWNEYYENGQVKVSGYYFKGQKNSGWKYYSSKGKLTMLAEFRNGKLTHRKHY